MKKSIFACLASAALLALAGCGPTDASSSSSPSDTITDSSSSDSGNSSSESSSSSSSSSDSSSDSKPVAEVKVEITTAPESSLKTGESFTFQAKVENTSDPVVWSIECDPSDMGANIDSEKGVLTVGDKPGKIVVTASAGGKTHSVTVTVVEAGVTFDPISQAALDEAGKGVKATTTLTSQYVGDTPTHQYYETIASPEVVYYAYASSPEGLSNPTVSNRYENHEGIATTVELGIDNKPSYTNLLQADPYIEGEYTNLSWADSDLGSVFASLKSDDFSTSDGVNYILDLSGLSDSIKNQLVLTFLPHGDDSPKDSWTFEYLEYEIESFSVKVEDGKISTYKGRFKDIEFSWGAAKQLSFEGTIEATGEGLISLLAPRTNTIVELEAALAELRKGNYVAEFQGEFSGAFYGGQSLHEKVILDGSSVKVEAITGQGAKFDYGYAQSGEQYVKLEQNESGDYRIVDIKDGNIASLIPSFGFSSVFFSAKSGEDNVYAFDFSAILPVSSFYISDDAFPLNANYVKEMSIDLSSDDTIVFSLESEAVDEQDDFYDITITYSQIGKVTENYPDGSIPDPSIALVDSMLEEAAQGIHLKSQLYEQDVVEGETPEADVYYYETYVSNYVNLQFDYYGYGFDYATPKETRYENRYAEASLTSLGLDNQVVYEPLLVKDDKATDGYSEMYWSDSGLKNIFSELTADQFVSNGEGKYSLDLTKVGEYVKENLYKTFVSKGGTFATDAWEFELEDDVMSGFELTVVGGEISSCKVTFENREPLYAYGDPTAVWIEAEVVDVGDDVISPLTPYQGGIEALDEVFTELKAGNYVATLDYQMKGEFTSLNVNEVLTADGESFKVEKVSEPSNVFAYGYYQDGDNYSIVSYANGQYVAVGVPTAGQAKSLLANFAISSVFFKLQAGSENVYEFVNPGLDGNTEVFYVSTTARPVLLRLAESLTVTLEDNGNVVVSFAGEDGYGVYDITITYSSIGEVDPVFPNGIVTA